jgi:hypothetical protein
MIQNIVIECSILELRLRIRINIFDISRSIISALIEIIRICKPVRNRRGLADARSEHASRYIQKDDTTEVTGECILLKFTYAIGFSVFFFQIAMKISARCS